MTETLFIIHLNSTVGKKLIKKADKLDEAVHLITNLNKGSVYLKQHSFDSFEIDDSLEDGLYVVQDKDFIHVLKLQTLKLQGYLYDSIYRVRNIVNRYEIIYGNNQL